MQYSKHGVYNLYRTIKDFLKNPTTGRYKNLIKNDFNYYTQHYFNNTPKWNWGADQFISLANALNSGEISLMEIFSTFIGETIIENKPLNLKNLSSVKQIKDYAKFYTIFETKKQFQYIKELETSLKSTEDSMDEFTDNVHSIYAVDDEQKNGLYKLIKERKINFFCFIFAWNKGKFEIDESKITDPEYKLFIECMNIIKRNIYEK